MPVHFLEAYPESVELIELLEVFLSGNTSSSVLSLHLAPHVISLWFGLKISGHQHLKLESSDILASVTGTDVTHSDPGG